VLHPDGRKQLDERIADHLNAAMLVGGKPGIERDVIAAPIKSKAARLWGRHIEWISGRDGELIVTEITNEIQCVARKRGAWIAGRAGQNFTLSRPEPSAQCSIGIESSLSVRSIGSAAGDSGTAQGKTASSH
jgi:hypothetical protein